MAFSQCAKSIQVAQTVLGFLGASVGIAFAMQGVLIFIGPAVGHDERPTDDFKTFCHWVSEATLCVWAGLVAVIMEIRACCPGISQRLGRHVLSSFGRALLFVWIGGYSSGGRIQMGDMHWQLVGQITGIAAWVACLGHLLLACCIERPANDDVVAEQDQEADAASADVEQPAVAAVQVAGEDAPAVCAAAPIQ